MAVSLRESVQQVSDPRNLDASVEEVFHLMLGVNCQRTDTRVDHEPESVTSVVGFGGLLSGACVFRSGGKTALKIAACMTGMEFDEIDDTVKDGIGELCNMLAGLLVYMATPPPDVLISSDAKLIALADPREIILFRQKKAGASRDACPKIAQG